MSKIVDNLNNFLNYYKKLLKLLKYIPEIKFYHTLFFFFIMLLSAFFEISLIGFLFVLIKIFMDPSLYQTNFYLKYIIETLNINSTKQLVIYLSTIFVFICIVAGFFRLIFYYLISKYVYFFSKKITRMCFQRMIYQDYKNLFLTNRNDNLSIFQKMPIINNSFYNTLLMINNFFIFIFIFLILAYINFKITLTATLFFLSIYISIILLLKKKIFYNGNAISDEQIINIKIVRETFNGFRDILVNNYQNFYSNLFLKSYSKLSVANEENRFLSSVPKPIIETCLLMSIGVLIGYNSGNYENLEKMLPNIAVLAIASQRILPILNQLYGGHVSNIDALPHIGFIKNFIEKSPLKVSKNKIIPIKFEKEILLKNVSFSYTDKNNSVLKNINLKISSGSRIGIIGKSGSGKSTFADLILGLLDPDTGNIFVDGKDIKKYKQGWFINVASVPQDIFITDQSIAENVAFGQQKKFIKLKDVKIACKKAEINSFIEAKKSNYKSLIGEKGLKISTGQRQRLAIARALYKKSKLIIFDEATSSLDSMSEKNIFDTIFKLSRKNYTSIIISHKLSNLKRCDNIYKITNSKIIKFK